MTEAADQPTTSHGSTKEPSGEKRSRWGRWLRSLGAVILAYLLVAYVILPFAWRHYEHHPALAEAPKTTDTSNDIPGDPLNVGLVGSKEQVVAAFLAAGWHPADAVDVRSSVKIAASVVLDRPYADAPVSPLYLFGRKQDLAFEEPAGKSAKRRHHVRLWRDDKLASDGRTFWLGGATFDDGVGVSHYTGQITHHISPDVDAERDNVIHCLEKTGDVTETYQVTGVGATLNGRNGGGDWYYTDGELTVAVLKATDAPRVSEVKVLPNPPAVHWKNRFWKWLRQWLP